MRHALAVCTFLLSIASTATAHAYSGFLKQTNSGYVKFTFDTLTSRDLYLTTGDLIDTGTEFTQRNISLYGEYGVTSYLTVGVNAPLVRFNSFEMSETGTGLGDIQIFAKAGLTVAGFALALTVAPEFPTGRDEVLEPDGFGGRINLPTGDGEFSTWFRLAASRALPGPDWLASYVSVHGGYNLRGKWADQIGVGGEIGVSFVDWVWVQGRIEALFSPTPVEDLDPEGIFLFGEGTEYVAVGGSISGRIPATFLWLDVGVQHTFANLRNLYAGTTFSVGLAADW